MIFGFFGGNKDKRQEEPEEEEIDPVRFLGALNGIDPNLKANQRLVDAGLVQAKDMVTDGMARRADTIRIEPAGAQSKITLLIDGVPASGGRLAKTEGLAVTQMLKLLAGLDIKERKSTQTGGIKAEFESKAYELTVISSPVPEGERLTIRVTDHSIKLETPSDLGMSDEMRKKLRELCAKKGVVITAGPPGSGTTTTNYAVLRGVDAYTASIFSIGNVGTRKLVNITPFEVNPGDPLENTLSRVIRVEADVLFLDPLKNAADAKVVFARSEDVTLISEMTAKDSYSAIVQLCEWVGDPAVVAKGLNAVFSQKLIRLLCTECKQAYRPKAEIVNSLPGNPSTLYRKPPESQDPNVEICSKCNGIGYYGRIAMFELIEMTEAMKTLVAARPDVNAIRGEAKLEKMTTLQQDGFRLVAEGKTSLEELQRVLKAPGT